MKTVIKVCRPLSAGKIKPLLEELLYSLPPAEPNDMRAGRASVAVRMMREIIAIEEQQEKVKLCARYTRDPLNSAEEGKMCTCGATFAQHEERHFPLGEGKAFTSRLSFGL